MQRVTMALLIESSAVAQLPKGDGPRCFHPVLCHRRSDREPDPGKKLPEDWKGSLLKPLGLAVWAACADGRGQEAENV